MSPRFLPLLWSLLALCACGERAPDAATASSDPVAVAAPVTVAAPAQQTADPHDPCRLLEPAEVEAILGQPLAGAPFRAAQPISDRGGIAGQDESACWYETADGRNIAVQAEWTDAGAILAGVGGWLAKAEAGAQGMIRMQDGTELTGDWDEVKVLGCCTFAALMGDSMVEIDIGGSDATLEQAGTLANAALARLEAPLPINGNAGIEAAQARRKARPAIDGFCGLWNAQDIDELLGPLQGTPELSDNTCTYTYRDDRGRQQMFMSIVVMRNGARRYRSDNHTSAGMTASLRAEHGQNVLKDAQSLDGPWDEAMKTPLQFNTRKGDIQIAIRHRGIGDDDLRLLLQRAYRNLGITKESAS